jgi:hypothetical protein
MLFHNPGRAVGYALMKVVGCNNELWCDKGEEPDLSLGFPCSTTVLSTSAAIRHRACGAADSLLTMLVRLSCARSSRCHCYILYAFQSREMQPVSGRRTCPPFAKPFEVAARQTVAPYPTISCR